MLDDCVARGRPRPARLAAPQRLAGRRWAPTATATPHLGDGELGDDGCAVFLSEPRFEGLPCVLETPRPDGLADDLERCRKLRKRGLRAARGADGQRADVAPSAHGRS